MNHLSSDDEQALAELQASLLRRKRPELQPGQGDEAFDQHMLLAIAVHRAARLHQSVEGERNGWIEYVTAFFPKGRNSEADARLLWDGWRCTLLKDEKPVVPITHGQSFAHWGRDAAGQPMLNLEDAWDDYAYSVAGLSSIFAEMPSGARSPCNGGASGRGRSRWWPYRTR